MWGVQLKVTPKELFQSKDVEMNGSYETLVVYTYYGLELTGTSIPIAESERS